MPAGTKRAPIPPLAALQFSEVIPLCVPRSTRRQPPRERSRPQRRRPPVATTESKPEERTIVASCRTLSASGAAGGTTAPPARCANASMNALLRQPGGFEGLPKATEQTPGEEFSALSRRSASISLRQRTRENLFSDFVPDLFRLLNTHFPAIPLKSPEPPVTLSLESWGRTLPRYLMWPEPPISPLR